MNMSGQKRNIEQQQQKKIQTYEHIGNHQQTRIRSVCEKPEK